MSDYDPFQLSTGLPEHLDCSIRQAWFEFDPEYNNGQTLVIKFEIETTDDDFGENGTGIIFYGAGTGWQAAENGARAEREDGNEKKGFNNNSAYGLWIGAAITCDGAEGVLRSETRGDPRYAGMWVGTAWHLDRQEKDYGGEIGKVSRLIPTGFLGEMESIRTGGTVSAATKKVAGPVKAAAKKLPAATKSAAKKVGGPVKVAAKKVGGTIKKASPPPTPAPVEELPAEDTGEMFETLVALALECDTHEQFIERAYGEVEGVNGVADVEQQVLSQEEGSPWAEAVARWEASQG